MTKKKTGIYFDLDTGLYGDASNIVFLDITEGASEVLLTFAEMSHKEREKFVLFVHNKEKQQQEEKGWK